MGFICIDRLMGIITCILIDLIFPKEIVFQTILNTYILTIEEYLVGTPTYSIQHSIWFNLRNTSRYYFNVWCYRRPKGTDVLCNITTGSDCIDTCIYTYLPITHKWIFILRDAMKFHRLRGFIKINNTC